MDFWWLIALLPLAGGAAGAYLDADKGRSPVEGFALGVLLGPLGLFIVFLLPDGERDDLVFRKNDDFGLMPPPEDDDDGPS